MPMKRNDVSRKVNKRTTRTWGQWKKSRVHLCPWMGHIRRKHNEMHNKKNRSQCNNRNMNNRHENKQLQWHRSTRARAEYVRHTQWRGKWHRRGWPACRRTSKWQCCRGQPGLHKGSTVQGTVPWVCHVLANRLPEEVKVGEGVKVGVGQVWKGSSNYYIFAKYKKIE